MKREEKKRLVRDLKERLEGVPFMILVDYRGMNVASMNRLRSLVRNSAGEFQVVKNRLLRLAVEGGSFEKIKPHLCGPTALALAEGDASLFSRTIVDFLHSQAGPRIKAGILGRSILDAEAIEVLSQIPPRQVLLARMVGALGGPMRNMLFVFSEIIGRFVRTVEAIRGGKAG